MRRSDAVVLVTSSVLMWICDGIEAHSGRQTDLAFGIPWISLPALRNNARVLPTPSHEVKPSIKRLSDVDAEEILSPLVREAREFRIKKEVPGHTFKSGVGVITFVTNPNHPGAILLGKRKGGSGEGTWSLPGGHLELGESFEECAHREVLEETALPLKNLRVTTVDNAIDLPSRFHYVVIFVTAETTAEPVNLEEDRCEGWEWVQWDAEDFPSPLFTPLENLRRQGFNPFGADAPTPWVPLSPPLRHDVPAVSNLHSAAKAISANVQKMATSLSGPRLGPKEDSVTQQAPPK